MNQDSERRLWRDVWYADDVNIAYFAARTARPGVVMFTAERDDAPEFDLARIYQAHPGPDDATLQAITRHYAPIARRPRLQLSPWSSATEWATCLQSAGYVSVPESLDYFLVPSSTTLRPNRDVRVDRVTAAVDADRFSAVQGAGFDLSPAHCAWDRDLARRHWAGKTYAMYLATLAGRAVGAARSARLPNGITVLAALATVPEARGQGVATSIFTRMIADARNAGSHLICGAVDSGGYAARMYQALGFVTLFTSPVFVWSNADQPFAAPSLSSSPMMASGDAAAQ